MKRFSILPANDIATKTVFAIVIAWACIGIFPLTSYEGDAISIITAVQHPDYEGYGRWMQPLTYAMLSPFRSLGVEQCYCLLTAVCAFVLIWVSMRLVQTLTALPSLLCLCSVLLIPESYYLSMYPNSAAPALLCCFGALMCMLHRRDFAAVGLLCVAPLLRLDVVVVYPVVLPILLFRGDSLRRAIGVTAVAAAAVILTAIVGYRLLGGDILFTLNEFERWHDLLTPAKRLQAAVGFYSPVGLVLVLCGLWIARRNRPLLAVVLTALACVHITEFGFANAAKHFAPLIPFAAALVAVTLARIMRMKSLGRCILITMIALSQVLGPTLRTTGLTKLRPIICGVIGAGQEATTADEVIILSGNIFYPFFVHNIKEENLQRQQILQSIVTQDNTMVIGGTHEALMRIVNLSYIVGMDVTRITPELPHAGQPLPSDESRLAFADSVRAVAPAAIIPSLNAINHKYDDFLRSLASDSVIYEIAPHIYALRN